MPSPAWDRRTPSNRRSITIRRRTSPSTSTGSRARTTSAPASTPICRIPPKRSIRPTSSGFITNAGGFHFAQGTTLLSGGSAGNDFNAFASLLLGLPQDAGKIYQFQDEYFSKTRSYALYIRDRWQVTPKLTLTYGVRWDYFPFPTRKGTGTEVFNAADQHDVDLRSRNSVPSDCGITKDKGAWDLASASPTASGTRP